jgi:hypothetical protein
MKKGHLITAFLGLFVFSATLPFALADDENRLFIQTTSNGQDKYAFDLTVNIEEETGGDVYASGQSLKINAPVGEDVGLAGMIIEVYSNIGDDIRAAGQIITIGSTVGDSITIAGQKVVLRNSANIAGDAWIAAETIEINAPINGDIILSGSNILINSQIGGNAKITGGEIRFGENGRIAGDLVLKSANNVDAQKVGGKLDWQERLDFKPDQDYYERTIRDMYSWSSIITFVSVLLIGALILYLMPKAFVHSAIETRASPFISLGVGFLGFVGIFALSLILLITVIGMPLGFIMLFAYFAMIIFAYVIQGLYVGSIILPAFEKETYWRLYGTFALGSAIVFLLNLIPYLGIVIKLVILWVAIGSLIRMKAHFFTSLRKHKEI